MGFKKDLKRNGEGLAVTVIFTLANDLFQWIRKKVFRR